MTLYNFSHAGGSDYYINIANKRGLSICYRYIFVYIYIDSRSGV